jgi:general secretion pathway protein E
VPADIELAFERLYGEGRSAMGRISAAVGEREDDDRDTDLGRLKDLASEAPVIRLVNAVITRAVEMGASDLHLESGEAGCGCAIGSTAFCARSSRRRRASKVRSSGV